jgi:hypothetical protein
MESTKTMQEGKTDELPERYRAIKALVGKRVAIQEKPGPIVSGLLASFEDGYLKVEDAVITGRAKKASPPFVLVHQSAIAHVHPEVETEKV